MILLEVKAVWLNVLKSLLWFFGPGQKSTLCLKSAGVWYKHTCFRFRVWPRSGLICEPRKQKLIASQPCSTTSGFPEVIYLPFRWSHHTLNPTATPVETFGTTTTREKWVQPRWRFDISISASFKQSKLIIKQTSMLCIFVLLLPLAFKS